MQPTQRFKKTLLASAVLFGTGITLNASAALFPVTAEAVPDVSVTPVVGTQISFGESVIGNKSTGFCQLTGLTHISDADLLFDANGAGATDTNAVAGNTVLNSPITTGTGLTQACVTGSKGEIIVLEIDGADSSTVQVTVEDLPGTGWIWTPTAESCVVDFDGALDNTADSCRSLAGNTVTNVGMSAAQVDGINTGNTNEIPTTAAGFLAVVGKTRMVLAGRITLSADLGQGTIVSENILVQVTYE